MTTVTNQVEVHTPFDVGPVLQVAHLPAAIGLATTVTASGSVTSDVIMTNGYKNIALGIKSSQGGAVSIQRYLDAAGTIIQGAAITGVLVANTALNVNNNDGLPFQSIKITATNTDGVDATLTNTLLLLQAN